MNINKIIFTFLSLNFIALFAMKEQDKETQKTLENIIQIMQNRQRTINETTSAIINKLNALEKQVDIINLSLGNTTINNPNQTINPQAMHFPRVNVQQQVQQNNLNSEFTNTPEPRQKKQKISQQNSNISNELISKFRDAIENNKITLAEEIIKTNKNIVNVLFDEKIYLTPIYIAITKDYKDIVELLINSGANVKTAKKINFVNTLLSAAIKVDNYEIFELLVKAGANLNEIGTNGATALILASQCKDTAPCNHKNMVELLIKAGANINIKSQKWGTALLVAAKNNKKELVKLLLNSKATLDEKDFKGDTALSVAKEKKFIEIIQMLENAQNTNNPNETVQIITKSGQSEL